MNVFLKLITQVYRYLLRLYPRSMQEGFAEEMLSDFSDLAFDASKKGIFSLLIFYMRELFDFPVNLVRIYEMESHMLKVLRLQPVNYGLRGAIGLGIGFAASAVAMWVFSSWVFSTFDSRLPALSVWIFDTFHNDMGMTLLWNILSLISSALTGLIFGLLFAFITGHHANYSKYMLAGALGWFIPVAISFVLSASFGWSFYLNTTQSYVLGIATKALVGAFLGAMFYIAESDSKNSLLLLGAGSILYPLCVYLYVKLLFYVWLETTEWFFMALMTMVIILLGSVFALARVGERRMPWATVVGAIAYPILDYSIYHLAYSLMHLPAAGPGEAITPNTFLVYELTWAGVQAFFGAVFGLLLGLILGYQKKNNSPQFTAKL